jgi:hypothetical protein
MNSANIETNIEILAQSVIAFVAPGYQYFRQMFFD